MSVPRMLSSNDEKDSPARRQDRDGHVDLWFLKQAKLRSIAGSYRMSILFVSFYQLAASEHLDLQESELPVNSDEI